MLKNLKKFFRNFKFLWKFLVFIKENLIRIARYKDVLLMMSLVSIWPEQTYRFSTRKLLPSKKNRFEKKTKPIFPYYLLKDKCSEFPKMKEINVVARGSSFDLQKLKKMHEPTFLISFWGPIKIDENGKLFYRHSDKYKPGKFKLTRSTEETLLLHEKSNDNEFFKENITYVTGKSAEIELLKRNKHKILDIKVYHDGDDINDKNINRNIKCISIKENIYKPPLLKPNPNWAPSGSFLPALCALSNFAEKINVYGWDGHLNKSPESMNFLKLLYNMYDYKLFEEFCA